MQQHYQLHRFTFTRKGARTSKTRPRILGLRLRCLHRRRRGRHYLCQGSSASAALSFSSSQSAAISSMQTATGDATRKRVGSHSRPAAAAASRAVLSAVEVAIAAVRRRRRPCLLCLVADWRLFAKAPSSPGSAVALFSEVAFSAVAAVAKFDPGIC